MTCPSNYVVNVAFSFSTTPPFAGANRGVVKGAICVSIGMYGMPLNYVVDVRLPAP